MNKRLIYILSFILTLIMLIGCSIVKNVKKSPTEYSNVNEQEIKEFISQEEINVIGTKIFERCKFSVVAFSNGDWNGYYEVYKDQSGKIYSRKISGLSADNLENRKILMMGGTKNLFSVLKINDDELLKKTKEYEVIYSDGSKEKFEYVSQALIFEYPDNTKEYEKIKFYDNGDKLLYEFTKL